MSQAGAICFVLAPIVVPVLWALWVQREQQLRAIQGERVMKNLREVVRENIASPGRHLLTIPAPVYGELPNWPECGGF
jgi:hypothetical protein